MFVTIFQITTFGLVVAVTMLPLITVDIDHVPEQNDNLESLINMLRKTSALCMQRFNDIVDDFVRWGLI
jgi:hypothetical protein